MLRVIRRADAVDGLSQAHDPLPELTLYRLGPGPEYDVLAEADFDATEQAAIGRGALERLDRLNALPQPDRRNRLAVQIAHKAAPARSFTHIGDQPVERLKPAAQAPVENEWTGRRDKFGDLVAPGDAIDQSQIIHGIAGTAKIGARNQQADLCSGAGIAARRFKLDRPVDLLEKLVDLSPVRARLGRTALTLDLLDVEAESKHRSRELEDALIALVEEHEHRLARPQRDIEL